MVAIVFLLLIRNIFKEKKQEEKVNDKYKITQWQRKYLCQLIKAYLKDNDLEDDFDYLMKDFEKYVKESTYWNLDELLELSDDMVKNITIILFEVAQESYSLRHFDDAVLVLHAIDFINGGMDNPDYFDGEYPWIGEDIPEMRNYQDMTDEEARTLYIYESAVEELYSFVDPDIDKIPEGENVLSFCKRLSKKDMEDAVTDLCGVIDILNLTDKTRDVTAKSLFNSISYLLGDIFNEDGDNYVQYVDEYRRYQIRALASVIDKQLYSDVVASIDD
jgi:hypothetical protein